MVKPSSSSSSTSQDAFALFNSLRSAYTATPAPLKIIDLYVGFTVSTAIIQVLWLMVDDYPAGYNSRSKVWHRCLET